MQGGEKELLPNHIVRVKILQFVALFAGLDNLPDLDVWQADCRKI